MVHHLFQHIFYLYNVGFIQELLTDYQQNLTSFSFVNFIYGYINDVTSLLRPLNMLSSILKVVNQKVQLITTSSSLIYDRNTV
jgi:hypothetical protein